MAVAVDGIEEAVGDLDGGGFVGGDAAVRVGDVDGVHRQRAALDHAEQVAGGFAGIRAAQAVDDQVVGVALRRLAAGGGGVQRAAHGKTAGDLHHRRLRAVFAHVGDEAHADDIRHGHVARLRVGHGQAVLKVPVLLVVHGDGVHEIDLPVQRAVLRQAADQLLLRHGEGSDRHVGGEAGVVIVAVHAVDIDTGAGENKVFIEAGQRVKQRAAAHQLKVIVIGLRVRHAHVVVGDDHVRLKELNAVGGGGVHVHLNAVVRIRRARQDDRFVAVVKTDALILAEGGLRGVEIEVAALDADGGAEVCRRCDGVAGKRGAVDAQRAGFRQNRAAAARGGVV